MSTKWIDYSGARPNPREIKAAGATGVLRYLSEPVPATAWKRITVAEKDALLAAGVDIILNWEWYEGRMLEGAPAGAHDGVQAAKQARALGYPRGATIFFSHDTGVRNDAAVLNYMRAAQHAMGDEYQADIYSGYDTVEMAIKHGVARYGWQTLAWSNGRVGSAHLYQNGKQWFHGGADENIVLRGELGSWLQTLKVNPSPKPRPKPTPTPTPAPPIPRPAPKPTPTPKPPRKPPLVPAKRTYKVRDGDTLAKIAKAHETKVWILVRLNPSLRKNPDLIYVGQVLTLPAIKGPVVPPPVKVYRIKPGDTLGDVARVYGTSVAQLVAWNHALIKNPNHIRVGWVIRVH